MTPSKKTTTTCFFEKNKNTHTSHISPNQAKKNKSPKARLRSQPVLMERRSSCSLAVCRLLEPRPKSIGLLMSYCRAKRRTSFHDVWRFMKCGCSKILAEQAWTSLVGGEFSMLSYDQQNDLCWRAMGKQKKTNPAEPVNTELPKKPTRYLPRTWRNKEDQPSRTCLI